MKVVALIVLVPILAILTVLFLWWSLSTFAP